jgi:hypothetical protein
VGRSLRAALVEVFGDYLLDSAPICPFYTFSLLQPDSDQTDQDLRGDGCMNIGALPSLYSSSMQRHESQAWGTAIYEDRPAGPDVAGILYPGAHNADLCQVIFDTGASLSSVQDIDLPADGRPLVDMREKVQSELREVNIRATWIRSEDCRDCRNDPFRSRGTDQSTAPS